MITITKIIRMVFVIMILLTIQNNCVLAEKYLVEGDGQYIVGDGPEENINIAKKRAKLEALRNAVEKAGVYVESYTHTVNNQINKDEIKTVAGSILKIESSEIKPIINGESIEFCCHIKAWVDTSNIDLREILQNKKLVEKTTEQQKKINELNTEITNLKKLYKEAKNDLDKEKIQHQIKTNENKLEAILVQISEYESEEFLSAMKYNAYKNNINIKFGDAIHMKNKNATYDSDVVILGENAKNGCVLILYTNKDGRVFKATLSSELNNLQARIKTYEAEKLILNVVGIEGERLNHFMNDIRSRDIPFGLAVWSYLANRNIAVEHMPYDNNKNLFYVRITAYDRLFPPERR